MGLDRRCPTVDEVAGGAVVVGLDLWVVILPLQVVQSNKFYFYNTSGST